MPAYKFAIFKGSPGKEDFQLWNKDVLDKGEGYKFQISHMDDNKNVEGCELTMVYMDQMGEWYKQKAKVGKPYEFEPYTYPPEPMEKKDHPLRGML